jgi:hypothetical protein
MSTVDHPRKNRTTVVTAGADTAPTAAGKVPAVLRIATGLVFGWAFVDKPRSGRSTGSPTPVRPPCPPTPSSTTTSSTPS